MKPELIVMLTHHDQTVSNAIELFDMVKHLPVSCWGFKDVGVDIGKLSQLAKEMRKAEKTTFFEVVSLTEDEGLNGAKLAVDLGLDILMGTVFFDSINEFLADKPTKYYPFPGHVHSHPTILDGGIQEIVQHAQDLQYHGVDGLDLLTYRYIGDAPSLLGEVVKATSIPVVSAGSIQSFNRIATVWKAGAWGFTIGSAFFDAQFSPGGTFVENVLAVCEWLQNTEEMDLP